MNHSDCLVAASSIIAISYTGEQIEQIIHTAECNPGVMVAFDTDHGGHGSGHVVSDENGAFQVAG